ncbi:MAG: hypothetical protein U0527_08435 [Candidatus Eisenbacteria bacterium]
MAALPPSDGMTSTWTAAFDPDLALIEEETEPDFPARLRAFKQCYPRCQLLFFGRADSELSPRRLHPISVRHWFFQPVDADDVGRVLRAAGHSLRRQWHEEHRRSRELRDSRACSGATR